LDVSAPRRTARANIWPKTTFALWLLTGGPWRSLADQHRQGPDVVELHDDHRSLRLNLTAAHLTLLRAHVDKHGQATLTETEAMADTGWIEGHVHEIVMPFTRAGFHTTAPAATTWLLLVSPIGVGLGRFVPPSTCVNRRARRCRH
jgi:hypothetical protein